MPEKNVNWESLRILLKGWIRPTAVLSLTYMICLSSILQADFMYRDDLRRAAEGARGWGFGRYLSLAFSLLLHTDTYLSDISPLPQMLAVVLISAACIVLHRVLKGDDTFTFFEYAALLPVGLYPYFLGCISYKYDSVYMAFSVLVSLIPLLMREAGTVRYGAVVFVSTLAMCMTYQASSGIFPAMVVLTAVIGWTEKKQSVAETARFLICSAAGYAAGLIVFRLFFVRWGDEYVDTSLTGISGFLPTALANYRKYAGLFMKEFRLEWKLCLAVLCILGICAMIKRSERGKAASLIVVLAGTGAAAVLSLGIYPILSKPLFQPRAMYGTGVLIAALGLTAVLNTASSDGTVSGACLRKYFVKCTVFTMSFLFAVFAFTYGNALQAQADFTDFRTRQLISDLIGLKEFDLEEEKLLQLSGDIGFAPLIQNMPEQYRLIRRLVPHTLKGGYMWGEYGFFHYYGLPNIVKDDTVDLTEEDLPVLLENSFHTIKGDKNRFLILLRKQE